MLRPCPYSYCTLYALFNNCCPQRLGSIYLLSLVRLLWIWLDPGHLTSLQLIGPSWVLGFLNFCGQKRHPESLLAAVPRLSPPLTLFAFYCEIDLNGEYKLLPSKQRYRIPQFNKIRLKNFFVCQSILKLNMELNPRSDAR